MESELIDCIYEAAVRPDLWPQLLDQLAHYSETVVGFLFSASAARISADRYEDLRLQWVTSPWVREKFERSIKEGRFAENLRAERLLRADHPGFLTDRDICTEEEIATHPHYIFLRENGGIGSGAATLVRIPNGDTLIFSWDKWFVDGPVAAEMVTRLNGLRPHLARSALLATQIGLEQAQATASAMSMIGIAACVITNDRKFLAVNDLCQAMMPSVLCERGGGRVALNDAGADRLLSEALSRVDSLATALEAALSIPMPAKHERPAVVIHVLPLRKSAKDIFFKGSAVILLTPVSRRTPSEDIIRALFDLTATEAHIAKALAAGETIDDIAKRRHVSPGTIRQQLKVIFSKTGVSRQANLVGLLGAVCHSIGGRPLEARKRS